MTNELIREGVREGVAEVVYDLDGFWVATFTAHVSQPWEGPETLTISPALSGDDDDLAERIEALDAAKGIGIDVLSQLPLSDARMRLRRLRARELVTDADVAALRSRARGPEALALFADIYARTACHTTTPLVALSSASDLSSTALSQRAARARKAGYLTRPTDTDPGSVTAEGRKVLAQLSQALRDKWEQTTPRKEDQWHE